MCKEYGGESRVECPFKKQVIEKEDRKMTGEKITKKETYFLPCAEANCAAFDISSLKCKLVERVNHI